MLLLLGFSALVALAAATALRARPPRVLRVLQETVHTTGQAAVRLSIFVLAALVLLAHDVGFDFVLGAFAAGLVVGLALDSLLSATGLSLAALFLALLLVARGASSLLWLRELGPRRTVSLGLFGATGLPLIVAIVGIAADRGAIADDVGASLVGAGMISVLLFPLLATAVSGRIPAAERVEPIEAQPSVEY